jgi:hypothetical protein
MTLSLNSMHGAIIYRDRALSLYHTGGLLAVCQYWVARLTECQDGELGHSKRHASASEKSPNHFFCLYNCTAILNICSFSDVFGQPHYAI